MTVDELRECHAIVWQWRAKLADVWPTPRAAPSAPNTPSNNPPNWDNYTRPNDAIRMAITLMDDTLDKYQPNDPSDFGFGSFDIDHDHHTAQGTQP